MRKIYFIPIILYPLASCATGAPVAVVYPGHSLAGVGHSSLDLYKFSFNVSDSMISCHGAYDMRKAFVSEFSFPISCSDGRTATVTARRDDRELDKSNIDFPIRGKVVFPDGSVGLFTLGADSSKLNEKSIVYQNFIEGLNSSVSK